jgi:predicted O-methyltransferase YrrM
MEFLSQLAELYADQFSSAESADLAEINAQTHLLHPKAHMLSGKIQGHFLRFISTMLQPTYILEIGTFTGYSAICLAKGLVPGGALHTIELREEDANVAAANFSKFIQNKQVTLHCGNALDIIDTLPHKWDLIFIDADKTAYIDYYEKHAKAIHRFNEHVKNDPRTEQVILTIRDGITLIKKKFE